MANVTDPCELSFAQRHGLDDVEWTRIVERMGRTPNICETLLFARLWSEDVGERSIASLRDTIARSDTLKNIAGDPEGRFASVDTDTEGLALNIWSSAVRLDRSARENLLAAASDVVLECVVRGFTPSALSVHATLPPLDAPQTPALLEVLGQSASEFTRITGLPVLPSEEYFHPRYSHAETATVFCLSHALPADVSTPKHAGPGDLLVCIGAPTRRDGLGDDLLPNDGRGQQSEPRLSDLLLLRSLSAAILACRGNASFHALLPVTFQGTGVTLLNLANVIGAAVRINLNQVPEALRQSDPTSILFSQTPERLLGVIPRTAHKNVADILGRHDLHAEVVGEVVRGEGVLVEWNRNIIADVPYRFSVNQSTQTTYELVKFPPMLKRSAHQQSQDVDRAKPLRQREQDEWSTIRAATKKTTQQTTRDLSTPDALSDLLVDLLANPNLCSRDALTQRIDLLSGGCTIAQRATGNGVAFLSTIRDQRSQRTPYGFASSSRALLGLLDPYLGTVHAVADCMSKLAAVGAEPLIAAATLILGDPKRYREVCDISEIIRALSDSCREWGIGLAREASLTRNGTEAHPVLAHTTVAMTGKLSSSTNIPGEFFLRDGDIALVLGELRDEPGCSELSQYLHTENRSTPNIDFTTHARTCAVVRTLASDGLLSSCLAISQGGLGNAVSRACLGAKTPLGITLEIYPSKKNCSANTALWGESSSRFLLSFPAAHREKIYEQFAAESIVVSAEGKVGGRSISLSGVAECSAPITTAFRVWSQRFDSVLDHASDTTESSA